MKITFKAVTVPDRYSGHADEVIEISTDTSSASDLTEVFSRFLLALSYHPDTIAECLTDYETTASEQECIEDRAAIEKLHDRIAELEALVAEHTDIPYGEGAGP